jgi:membrane protein
MGARRSDALPARALGRLSIDANPRRAASLVRSLAGRFSEHGLFVYTSAISFRALVALVPLILLALGLLGALGQQHVWNQTLAPAIRDRVTPPVYSGINASVEKILTSGTAALIAFASVLLFWYVAAAITVVMSALNHIHEVEERRPLRRRIATAAVLAIAVAVSIIGAILLVVLLGQIDAGGVAGAFVAVVKWLGAVFLLGLAVGLLVRFAPAERPEARWASAGSITIVAGWVITTLAFRWWVTGVANFKTATGQLTFFLLLTGYVFAVCLVFLLGVELDELARKEAKGKR